MAFKTITARFSGSKCRRCGGAIKVGQQFRYGGRGNCWHLSRECPANQGNGQADAGHAPDVDRLAESESEAWARRAEEGWGPGGY